MADAAERTLPANIRVCTEADFQWMIDTVLTRYPNAFDVEQARAWATARVKDDRMIFMRGDHSFGVAHLAKRFNAPKHWQAYLTFIYSIDQQGSPFERFRIVRALRDWAKDRGATKFWLSDITGNDLGPFALRLGGRLAGHTYVIDLDDNANSFG